MVYYNSDGNESSMCGNGGRCLVAFAKHLGVISGKSTFEAVDGLHYAEIDGDTVKLQMQDVESIEKHPSHIFLNTGSPHHVQFENQIEDFDIKTKGAKIRYGKPYNEKGSNVNFVKKFFLTVNCLRNNISLINTFVAKNNMKETSSFIDSGK